MGADCRAIGPSARSGESRSGRSSGPVSRVLYPTGPFQAQDEQVARDERDGDHLSSLPACAGTRPSTSAGRDGVTAVVKQPTRGRAGRSWSLYSALLQVGFGHRCVTAAGRALLPPDFTLTPARPSINSGWVDGAVCFCATFRLPRRTDPLRQPGRYPAPCPEEPGLSSPETR